MAVVVLTDREAVVKIIPSVKLFIENMFYRYLSKRYLKENS